MPENMSIENGDVIETVLLADSESLLMETMSNDSGTIIELSEKEAEDDKNKIRIQEENEPNTDKQANDSGLVSTSSNEDQKNFFERMEDKVAEKLSTKLKPIEGGKLMALRLNHEIYSNCGSYKGEITFNEATKTRPTTATDNKDTHKLLSADQLKLKQIRANEIRVQSTEKRIRPITARRERYQERKAIADEVKRLEEEASREERRRREERVAANKAKIDSDRQQVRNSSYTFFYLLELINKIFIYPRYKN